MMVGMGYIGLDSGRLYRMRRGPKLIEAVASGTTIIINDATEGRPFRGLRVFGRTEQVQTTGAQLINTQGAGNSRGVDWVFDKGVVTFSGVTVDTSTNRVNCAVNVKDVMEIGKTYFAKSFTVGIASDVAVEKPSGVIYTREYTPDGTETGICIRVLVDKSNDAGIEIDLTAYVAITENERLSSWEPYTGGKPSPSPEYPQGIVSAGEGGSITVEVGGKNLLTGRLYFTNYSIDIPHVYNEDEVTLPYTPPRETRGIGYVVPCKPGVQYTFSVTNPNKNWRLAIAEYENFEQAKSFLNKIGSQYVTEKSSIKYTAVGNGVLVCAIAGKWTDGKTTIHECTESELLQLEYGDVATPYEPYRPHQTLNLQTPNGLPGVPVSKDGNYTDSNGQQWICDEIDLGRGKYVQRVAVERIQGNWVLEETLDRPGRFIQNRLSNQYAGGGIIALCNIASWKNWGSSNGDDRYVFALSGPAFYISPPSDISMTADELNAKLNALKDPVVVLGQLATPIERDLTPEEIAAYKALRTYGPTTVVSNDAGAGMEITYRKDKKNEKIHWNKVD